MTKPAKYKPLNLLNNKGFWPEKAAIVDAIKEVLTIGKCRAPLPISDYGRYRDRHWRGDDNELVPYHSVDWYVYDALDEDRLQVNAEQILKSLATEPWRRKDVLGDHYDLFIMEEDMYDPEEGRDGSQVGYLVGRSERLTAAVISTYRIEHIWGMPYSYLKTEVMRQLCFMFAVPDVRREDVTAEGDALYCKNVCILRRAEVAPDDWERLTRERLRFGPLCEPCTQDLRRFFEQVAEEKS
ncbi:MAG: hypothetical protein AMK73_02215 [Planctomycetes bacterium SM23_32]|nr:MAG: hypothetical protein AMK73_02215 [Planctomycetes bacterium SM23_32]